MNVHTYLNYGGNCAEAFQFYEKNLGAKIGMLMTQDQAPGATNLPPEQAKAVLHARITIGDTDIMASDVPKDSYQPIRSAYICLGLDTDAEAERIHKVLADGGQVFMPMQETFFASKFSMLRDKFGTSWMIIHEKPMGPPRP
jgi:PhnB protein